MPIGDLGNLVTELGVGAIFALLVIREVLTFLKNKKVSNSSVSSISCGVSKDNFENLIKQIDEMHEESRDNKTIVQKIYDMHNIKDMDGTYIWYVPRSVAGTQKEIVSILHNISRSQEALAATLERLERKETV